MKSWKNILVLVVLVLSIAFSAMGGTYSQDDDRVVLTWATTSPTVGDPVLKCAAKATGGIVGVALNGSATAAEKVVVDLEGVFSLPVVASSTVGNIHVGDYVYGSVGGLEVCTTTLSNINSGLIFGQALEAITASTTAQTIKVRLLQPSHL